MAVHNITANIAPGSFCDQTRTMILSVAVTILDRDQEIMDYLVCCECSASGSVNDTDDRMTLWNQRT